MGGFPVILLDTNALLFIVLNQDKLTDTAMRAITDADELLVSSISIWEIASSFYS
ncbi:MAG: PIN domain-containing protein [Spirochaetaceae bacterium]|nr:PIN domain-containing protein [Spirochaetaceae bacterium]